MSSSTTSIRKPVATSLPSDRGVARGATAGAFIALAASTPAYAELQVRVPEVDYLELEFEHNGLLTFDSRGSPLRHEQS